MGFKLAPVCGILRGRLGPDGLQACPRPWGPPWQSGPGWAASLLPFVFGVMFSLVSCFALLSTGFVPDF